MYGIIKILLPGNWQCVLEVNLSGNIKIVHTSAVRFVICNQREIENSKDYHAVV